MGYETVVGDLEKVLTELGNVVAHGRSGDADAALGALTLAQTRLYQAQELCSTWGLCCVDSRPMDLVYTTGKMRRIFKETGSEARRMIVAVRGAQEQRRAQDLKGWVGELATVRF